jgi:hypothetical protein
LPVFALICRYEASLSDASGSSQAVQQLRAAFLAAENLDAVLGVQELVEVDAALLQEVRGDLEVVDVEGAGTGPGVAEAGAGQSDRDRSGS